MGIKIILGLAVVFVVATNVLCRPSPDSAAIVPLKNGLAYGGIPYGSVSGQLSLYFENDESKNAEIERKPSDKPTKSTSNTPGSLLDTPSFKQDFLITPDERLIINPKIQPGVRQHSSDGFAQTPAGFVDAGSQRLLLLENNGRYDFQLQNFQQAKPSQFSTALGAISAHIVGQRTNPEYIPFPPNGDPYNYSAYRGYPHTTEPPVVKAYETASNANYGVQSSANFDQYSPRRALYNNGYQQGFPNNFNDFGLGFYNHPYLFNNGGFYSGLSRSDEPIYEDKYYNAPRENFRRPIKRFVRAGSFKKF